MTTATFSERCLEAMSPIVVKEVRQGLRAKVFGFFFGALLLVCLSLALLAFAQGRDLFGEPLGKKYFADYLAALGAVCFFVIPFGAFRSMSRELEDETWVLLTLTGLGALSVTRGKWVSAMTQALLFGSACAPFVLFSYFLSGVDLLQIAVSLALCATWSAMLTAFALGLATQAHGKLGRTLAHLVVLAVLGLGAAGGIAFAFVLANRGARLVTEPGFRNLVIALGLFSSVLTVLALEGAAASLALPSESASRRPRIALVLVTGVALVFGPGAFLHDGGRGTDAVAGQVLTCLFLAIAGGFCVSERDGWPRATAHRGWLKPGALRSFGLALALLLASSLVWGVLGATADRPFDPRHVRAFCGAALYPAFYLSLGVVLGRWTALARLGEPVATRVAFLGAIVVGTALSMALAQLVHGRAVGGLMNTFNPFIGLANLLDNGNDDSTAIVLLLLVGTLAGMSFAVAALRERDQVRA